MGRWSHKLAGVFVQFAGVESGDRVLDVGCGTGALTSALLPLLDSGRVVGVDPARAYVDFARSRISDPRATFEQGDGQQLRFSDSSFDATLSLLVLNFIPSPAKALDEMIRVTRPGGVVAAAVWDYGEGMEALRLFWDEAVALAPSAEDRDEEHMPLSRQGELAELWAEHGLVEVVETGLVVERSFSSFSDFWGPFREGQGPAGAYVASLSEADRTALEKRLRQRLPAGPDGAIKLKARAWAVKGLVPPVRHQVSQ